MKTFSTLLLFVCLTTIIVAQNPIVMDRYTADPSARVFNGKIYVYPSHDIRIDTGRFANWFAMEDYHVYSSENLTEWTDHGVLFNQQSVAWVDSTSYSMWAPDCIEKNGKYYFYFPSTAIDKSKGRGRRIGVAVSDDPAGPFIPESKPMEGVYGIDPNPFIDHDGQAYLYWGGGDTLRMAKLKDNLMELETQPKPVLKLPSKFKEGAYLFEREGIYYFTFPHVPETTERLVYATGDNPMGPFEYQGVIMDESPTSCWTNHHSIVEYKNQWYLFYHHNDLSPEFDKNRSIKVDSLFFNSHGSIQKVKPTHRGVGITSANSKIQIDRYTDRSNEGSSIEFVDSLQRSLGWKTVLTKNQAWMSYNAVKFSNGKTKKIRVKAKSDTGGNFEVRLNSRDGLLIAQGKIKTDNKFEELKFKVKNLPQGIHNIYFISTDDYKIEIDWINFE